MQTRTQMRMRMRVPFMAAATNGIDCLLQLVDLHGVDRFWGCGGVNAVRLRVPPDRGSRTTKWEFAAFTEELPRGAGLEVGRSEGTEGRWNLNLNLEGSCEGSRKPPSAPGPLLKSSWGADKCCNMMKKNHNKV